jgi:hypothetical protein
LKKKLKKIKKIKMDKRTIKWGVIFIIFCLLFVGVLKFVEIYDNFEKFKNYPSFDKQFNDYHKTLEIIQKTKTDSILNPHYIYYDLTPEIENEGLKIVGYGPVQLPEEIQVRVMVVCGQHGREYVSSELCFALIRLLQLQARDDNYTTRLSLLQIGNVGIWVVPVANPWARTFVELNETNTCRRTNANSIDLNRNFPHAKIFEWQTFEQSPYSDDGIHPEDNPGTSPLSEYETVAMVEYINYVDPHMIINIHSGSNDILLPYDYVVDVQPKHYRIMVKLANYARKSSCPECKLGTASTLLYTAKGTLIDYALLYTNTQLAYTLEIFSSPSIVNDHQLTPEECKNYFNPQYGDELLHVLRKWIHFILSLIEKLLKEIKQ